MSTLPRVRHAEKEHFSSVSKPAYTGPFSKLNQSMTKVFQVRA